MNGKSNLEIGALVTILLVASACQPLPTDNVRPVVTPASASSTGSLASTPSPTVTPAVAVDEEDCMGACHIPDPNDFIAAGAMPQPENHAGRAMCLTCHATLDKPVLPATHVGRMDASCIVCHAPTSK